MIISVDFDNTLARTNYPEIIEPIQPIIDYIKEAKSVGYTIILNTCRHDKPLEDAIIWCKSNGLEFDYINENSKEW